MIAAGAIAGCISLPDMKAEWRPSYLVEARRPASWAAAETGLTNYVLRLKRFRMADPLDSRSMMVLDTSGNAIKCHKAGGSIIPGQK